MWEKVVSQDVLVNKALIQLKSMRNGFLYRSTFTEAERKAEETDNHTLGGF